MNRNSETYFSEVPSIEMQRSTFDLSHEVQTTFNVGEVIPIDCTEIYPGDSFEVTTSKVVRLQTLLNPIFGTLYLDIYHFFVPNRLVHDKWPAVMGENMTGAWAPAVPVYTPQMAIGSGNTVELHSLQDYYGLPVGVKVTSFNALPIRGYELIWTEFFRDENLQDPLNIYKGDSTKIVNTMAAAEDLTEQNPHPRKAGRLHDYFSSCLPAPQKSENPVLIPFSGEAPVVTDAIRDYKSGDTFPPLHGHYYGGSEGTKLYAAGDTSGGLDYLARVATGTDSFGYVPDNLWAKLSAIDGAAITSTINDLRTAFQIQKMLERDSFGGSRYRELIRSHFSVSTGDARMQIPEYLGGNRIALNVSQVVNNSQDGTHALGNLGAMSHTVDVHGDYVKSFVEHGFVHTLAVVRYENMFTQGKERFWNRDDRYSYYWPSLAFLGNMAVKNEEIYASGTYATDKEVFGYQEAWADLRTRPNRATGLLRPGVSGSLASWNLADYYTETPVLSDGWIKSDKGIVDRTLAVTSAVSDQVFADFYFDVKATRVLPMFSVPGLIDHF